MSVQAVREYFAGFGREQDVLEFEQSSATVELAAQAVGVIPARIAKTLSFHKDEGGMLVVAAGDARIDNKKFKATFGCKARMLSPEEALSFTGHSVGGVCPFALAQPLPVYLDESLKRFDCVYPACGSSNSAIRLTCAELEQCARATGWVDVCKDWDANLA